MERADLVLAGGGVKGIAHVGALSAFWDRGYEFWRVAGTSAGAIVGALVAARMPAEKIQKALREVDYRKFRDRSPRDRIPLAGPALSVMLEDGLYEGDYLREWLGNHLADLHVETFADLRLEPDPKSTLDENQQFRLVVMAADLTRGELVRLPWNYRDRYGVEPDRMLVVDAVRASMSIPFFYEPVRLTHSDGSVSTLVDGGVLTNFPIDTFDRTDDGVPRWPTFGITLVPSLPAGNAKLFPGLGVARRGPIWLLESLVTTMMVGHDQAELMKPWVEARTIAVDTESVNVVDFEINRQAQAALFERGRATSERFLERWNWADYRRRFRRAPDPEGSDT
jgi:NTE family protein